MNSPSTPFSFLRKLAQMLFGRRKLFAFLALALFTGIGISTVYRGGFSPSQRTDLTVFIRAAEGVQNGENIYDVKTRRQWNYVYLPLLAILAVPFITVPFAVTVFFWYLFSVAALTFLFYLSCRLGTSSRDGFFAAFTASILAFPPILVTLTRGQLGVLVLLLGLAVFWLYLRRRDFESGFLLGFAVVLKTSPLAALVFFFLFRRNWKALLGFAAGALLFTFILPALVVGHDQNIAWIQEYLRVTRHAISDLGYQGLIWAQLVTPFADDNQSLHAVLTRLRWGTEEALIAGQTNETIRFLMKGFAALLLGFGAFSALRHTSRAPAKRLLLEFSLYPMLMLWVSPVTQNHHYTVFYLVFLAGIFYWIDLDEKDFKRRLFCETALLIGAVSFLLGLIFSPLAWYGLPVWGSVLATAMLYLPALKPEAKKRT